MTSHLIFVAVWLIEAIRSFHYVCVFVILLAMNSTDFTSHRTLTWFDALYLPFRLTSDIFLFRVKKNNESAICLILFINFNFVQNFETYFLIWFQNHRNEKRTTHFIHMNLELSHTIWLNSCLQYIASISFIQSTLNARLNSLQH